MRQQTLRERRTDASATVAEKPCATREYVRLEDFTDLLLQAYDGVARRAYQKFVGRGSKPGGELDDWLQAEQELGTHLKVDLAESKQFIHAMATVEGVKSSEVSVAIEGRWLMILGSQEFSAKDAPLDELWGMEWNSAAGMAVTVRRADRLGAASDRAAASGDASCAAGDESELIGIEDEECLRARWGSQPFCVVALPAEVDVEQSMAVLADGVLAVRMMKACI